MSNVDLKERPWRLHILDMIECSERVLGYTEGMDRQAFIAHGLTYDATLRKLHLIGAAARHIPTEVRQAHSEVPWDLLTGICNQLVHSYLTISDSLGLGVYQGGSSRTPARVAEFVGIGERERKLDYEGISEKNNMNVSCKEGSRPYATVAGKTGILRTSRGESAHC